MDIKALKRFTIPQILLAIAAFLIPIIGGQISTDRTTLEPGLGALLRSSLGGPFLAGMETPLFSHFILGALIAAAMIYLLSRRSVLQLPNIGLLGLTIAFFALLTLSVAFSSFKFVSFSALTEWLIYALAFLTVVTALGRQSGPRLVVTCLFAGIAVIALYGLRFEYWPASATEPSYRIFAGWINPNAAAGIFLIGFLLGVALLLQALERGPSLIVGLSTVLIGIALLLTGSKAGFAAFGLAGVSSFVILSLFLMPGIKKVVGPGLVIGLAVISFGMYKAIQMKNATAKGGASLGRVTAYGETSEQSWTFRKLLWQGSVAATKERPIGYGLGTYGTEGSRSGLTTPTALTHNSILQLAFEASPLAAATFLAFLMYWLVLVLRGARNMTVESNALRIGIVSAVLATMAQGLFESNLYYFGIGLTIFILFGVGLNLGADSVAPEFTPKGVRTALALLSSLPILGILYCSYGEWQKSNIRYLAGTGSYSEASDAAKSLVGITPTDGEAWALLARLDPNQRLEASKRAAELSPSPKNYRQLSAIYESKQEYASARSALRQALIRDPNNLPALSRDLALLQSMGNLEEADKVARRMIAVESTSYFTVKSLAQLIETDTCDAREYLASRSKSAEEKASLLQGALDLYARYAAATVPEVKRFSESGGNLAGEDSQVASDKCNKGLKIADELTQIYRALGDSSKVNEVAGARKVLEEGLASLGAK